MALPLLKTLGEIRADIQTRLGFGMAGSAGVVNSPLIDSFIRSAQEQLLEQYPYARLRTVFERNTGANQQFYDYPDGCDDGDILTLSVKWNGRYIPMTEGISDQQRSIPSGLPPTRYERRDQIEVWPIPQNADFILRFEFQAQPNALVNNSDRVCMPSQLVFLHALANAKAHYRQPDADRYEKQLNSLLEKLKQKNRAATVYGKDSSVGVYDYVDGSQDV